MSTVEPRSGATRCAEVLLRPAQSSKLAPCAQGCPNGNDVRKWIGFVAQRERLGLSKEEAYAHAWRVLTETNPFPATLGRICPHPCESACNRADKDGAVAINAMERFLGDWALRRRLPLARLEPSSGGASIGVVGAGPAGLSFAYQLARRGHRVTVYEKRAQPGGMLRHGIPGYRLPKSVVQAEIDRIAGLGVELKLSVTVGRDVPLDVLRQRHDLLFLGIGAGGAAHLGVPGEDGPGVLSGVAFLDAINRGEPLPVPENVVVVGGGNTAIDAARTARRRGAGVTVLYRRTRGEMPAIAREVDEALAEGVTIEFLAAPAAIVRDETGPREVRVRRMALGEPDDSGRRRPVTVPGAEFAVPARLVIVAVSQTIDWKGLEQFEPRTEGARAGDGGALGDGTWSGGDMLGPGIAGMAIAQGRQAAAAVHAMLTGAVPEGERPPVATPTRDVAADLYAECPPARVVERPVAERIARADLEVHETISEEAFLREAERCFSCGLCNGCQYCFMFCNGGGFVRVEQAQPGAYFALSLERCMGCGKCVDLCPTGYLSPADAAASPR